MFAMRGCIIPCYSLGAVISKLTGANLFSVQGHASAVQELLAAGPSASEVYNRKQQRPADCAVGEAAQIFAA